MKNLLKRFRQDKQGQMAVLFAFLSFPVLAAGGMAVDFASVSQQRSNLQNANDAAAIWAATVFRADRQLPSPTEVRDFINGNYELDVSMPQVTRTDSRVGVQTDARIDTYLMHMFDVASQQASVYSEATLAVNSILEFAMALDTTSSMRYDGRMTGLKRHAKDFINTMWNAKFAGADIRGSIVPFGQYVNVGLPYRNAPWMDVPPDLDTREWHEWCTRPVIGHTNCTGGGEQICSPATTEVVADRPEYYTYDDGVPIYHPPQPGYTRNIPASCRTTNPTCDPILGAETCTDYMTGGIETWHGVVMSRPYPHNLRDDNPNLRFPGPLSVTAGAPLQTLTDNKGRLISKINALQPNGETYIPDGLMWAMRTLSPEAPFTEGKPMTNGLTPDGKRIRKAIILMTDGMNTSAPSPAGGLHPSTGIRSPRGDQYTEEACQYAKDQDYEVYTITFGRTVPPHIKEIMENCASEKDLYFHAQASSNLGKAFNDIASKLLTVRLTH